MMDTTPKNMKMPSVFDFGWTPESKTEGIFFGQEKAEKSLQRNNFSALLLLNSLTFNPLLLWVISITVYNQSALTAIGTSYKR